MLTVVAERAGGLEWPSLRSGEANVEQAARLFALFEKLSRRAARSTKTSQPSCGVRFPVTE